MDAALRRPSVGGSAARRWSVFAGGYACAATVVLLVVVLSPIPEGIAEFVGMGAGATAVLLAAPVWFIGAWSWYGVVEEREVFSYPAGVTAGLLTAVVSILAWAGVLTLVLGPVLFFGWTAALVLLAIVAALVVAVGLTSMEARRRLGGAVGSGAVE